MAPLGQQEVIIRAIARNKTLFFNHWINTSASTFLFSVGFGIILFLFMQIKNFGTDATLAVYVVACGLPFAGLNLVAQAVLQGVERMEYQTIAAFIGRFVGLAVLLILLIMGAGVWSAFIGRAIFQVTSLIILSFAICRYTEHNNLPKEWRLSFAVCQATLLASMPFALQKFLTEGLLRLNIVILPMIVTLEAVGLFNAANQITQTSSTIIPIVMLALLPAFSRSFKEDDANSSLLADQTLKFMLILIFPFALIVTVGANKIILLLYGSGYEAAVPVLQLVIWSQVLVAADSVMKQNMIASDNERAMVWRSAVGIIINIALTVMLGKTLGLLGVAAAIVLSRAILLILDIEFVTRRIYRTNFSRGALKPFICAVLAGIVAFALIDHELLIVLPVTASAYMAFLFLFKTFSKEELSIIRQLFRRMLAPFKC
jgi:O-antigen/teichoic acid export membrane protein